MIVVAAVDDRYGMMFNKRRLSQDVVLREHLLDKTRGSRLWMNAYSANQFVCKTGSLEELLLEKNESSFIIAPDFLERAGVGEFCFVENVSVLLFEQQIEKVILYKWNRAYPADFYFDLPLTEQGWLCTVTEEFAGNSHEKITVEEWTR